MRYAVVLAGGSGTRLWPWSRSALPKQLLPLAGNQTLLQLAYERLEGIVPSDRRRVCAGESHRALICRSLGLSDRQYIGEPMGRDTVNALGLCAAVLHKNDPEAVIGVCTADHIIEPVKEFGAIFAQGLALAEQYPNALITFGIAPTAASTAYGYLQLGETIGGTARVVESFREKPDAPTAQVFFDAGPTKFLWNSGMFAWRAATLLDCIRRYEPETCEGLLRIAEAWDGPQQHQLLADVYPTLKKISVDFAVMERASRDPQVKVLAVPMPLEWIDVGSWNAFAEICRQDERGNALSAERHVLHRTKGTLVVSSDPQHLIAALGCEDFIIVHTSDATLVCRADQVENIKELHELVAKKFGATFV